MREHSSRGAGRSTSRPGATPTATCPRPTPRSHSTSTTSSGWRSSAHMVGRTDEAARAWERAYHAAIDGGQPARAVRDASTSSWASASVASSRRPAPGTLAPRGSSTPRDSTSSSAATCSSREALLALENGDAATAFGLFERVAELAGASATSISPTYRPAGSRPVARSRWARWLAGVAFLDEAMLAVTAGEVVAVVVGHRLLRRRSRRASEIFDLRRAQEWTAALTRWCDAQPDLVPFRGAAWSTGPSSCASTARGPTPIARPSAREAWLLATAARAGRRRGASTSGRAPPAARRARAAESGVPRGRPVGPAARTRARAAPPGAGRRSARPRRRSGARSAEAAASWPGRGCSRRSVEIMLATGDVAAARAAAAELCRAGRRDRTRRCCRRSRHTPRARSGSRKAMQRRAGGPAPGWAVAGARRAVRVRARPRRDRPGLPGARRRRRGGARADAAREAFARLGAAPDLGRARRASRRGAADRRAG